MFIDIDVNDVFIDVDTDDARWRRHRADEVSIDVNTDHVLSSVKVLMTYDRLRQHTRNRLFVWTLMTYCDDVACWCRRWWRDCQRRHWRCRPSYIFLLMYRIWHVYDAYVDVSSVTALVLSVEINFCEKKYLSDDITLCIDHWLFDINSDIFCWNSRNKTANSNWEPCLPWSVVDFCDRKLFHRCIIFIQLISNKV